ncbi:uncharacterized protein LOC108221196 [Daucus carota subsp. sativus]|uniref:uncharacterized protein LOC108221196 n=1 Tax=Daucus carota subsp. sativus TaxID=79200 RepID=UPI0030834A4B
MNLWVSTVKSVLTLIREILQDKREDCQIGVFVLHFSCVVIEPYTNYLKLHPTGKEGFNKILENLLELLLYILDVLHPHSSDCGWKGNLWKLIKQILSQGLFHPIHIDGFMSLQSLNKYVMSSDYQKIRNSKVVVKSYHRHFFDKVYEIMIGTNALPLGNNIGELFRSYVDCIKKQKELIVVGVRGSGQLQDGSNIGQIATVSSKRGSAGIVGSHTASGLNPDTRKLLFNFFIQLMEPLLGEIRTKLQDESEVGPFLSTAHCTIKSVNKLLVSFIHENVYVRIEDTSDGAFLNFLKMAYGTIQALSARIEHIFPSLIDSDERIHKEVIVLIDKDLISTFKCLLEIEWEVFGDELESLWLMMISHGASGHLVMDKSEQSLLIPGIIQLGVQVISLYSELRQVNIAVFTLCKAVRGLLSVGDGQMCYSNVWKPSVYCEERAKILRIVLCSHEFRLSIYNAIKFIPEGQVSGFIQLLTADVSESLVWMEGDCSTNARTKPGELGSDNCSFPCFKLKAEVLGRSLSELYSLILDSVTATTGNSTLVGVTVKDLIGEIRPNMQCLVGVQSDSVYSFMSTLTGRTITMEDECKHVCMSTLGGCVLSSVYVFQKLKSAGTEPCAPGYIKKYVKKYG